MRLIGFIICCLLSIVTGAQNKSSDSTAKQTGSYVQMCEVRLNNGDFFKGEVKEDTDSSLVLVLQDQQVKRFSKKDITHYDYYFARSKTRFLKEANEQHIGGSFYGATRNAFLFVPRKLEINSTLFALYNYNYNLHRNYSMGITTSLILAPILLRAKAHYQLAPKAYLGFEAYAGVSLPIAPAPVQGGVLKFTVGDYDAHLTVTATTAGADGDLFFAYGIAGSKRMAGDVYAVGELWTGRDLRGAVFTCGLRTVIKPRVSWFWGIGALVGEAARHSLTPYTIPFPYLGFSFRK